MAASFTINVDTHRNIVRMELSGFFSLDDVRRFVDSRDAAHLQLTCGPNQHLTLVDIRGIHIQSQEGVAAFQVALHNPEVASRRLAFVVGKSLTRSQIRRAASRRDASYFDSIEEADAWLLGD